MIHHVFANRSNIGDWLSARGIQSLLAPLPITEHLCDEPFVPHTLDTLAAAAPRDLIVIGGGGLFMDYFIPFWDRFRGIMDRHAFCIWGVGLCDLKAKSSHTPKNLLEEIIQASQLCIVRDEVTRAYLQGCDLPPPVPCPSLVAIKPPADPGRNLLHVAHYDVVGPPNYERMCTLARSFAERTGRAYCETNNRIQASSEAELQRLLDFYADAELVLSSRLHGCIIGLGMQRKVLAVSGDRKIESFMNAAGLADWVCDGNSLESLTEYLEALSEQHTPTAFVEHAVRENRAVADQVAALARSLSAN